jgi:D-serine deaminase-like pyridoxal phosphate-dependent protein
MAGSARGHSIDTIPTPALVLDAAKVRRNIERMADYKKSVGIANRPHTKTHKSIAIAGLQLAAGATGLTVAKVGEAETLVLAFADRQPDILIAYPAVDGARTVRLAALARSAGGHGCQQRPGLFWLCGRRCCRATAPTLVVFFSHFRTRM